MKKYINMEAEVVNLFGEDVILTSDPGKDDVDWDLTGITRMQPDL